MSAVGVAVVVFAVLLLIAMVVSNIARGRHSRRLADAARRAKEDG